MTETMTVTVSELASEKLDTIVAEQLTDDTQGVRIYARSGGCGCSGMSFGMGIDIPKPEDSVMLVGGIRIIVDPMTATNLEGASIDYVDEVQQQGFVIEAPNAKQAGGSCGCG